MVQSISKQIELEKNGITFPAHPGRRGPSSRRAALRARSQSKYRQKGARSFSAVFRTTNHHGVHNEIVLHAPLSTRIMSDPASRASRTRRRSPPLWRRALSILPTASPRPSRCILSWPAFTPPPGSPSAADELTLPIAADSRVSANLAPNLGANGDRPLLHRHLPGIGATAPPARKISGRPRRRASQKPSRPGPRPTDACRADCEGGSQQILRGPSSSPSSAQAYPPHPAAISPDGSRLRAMPRRPGSRPTKQSGPRGYPLSAPRPRHRHRPSHRAATRRPPVKWTPTPPARTSARRASTLSWDGERNQRQHVRCPPNSRAPSRWVRT